MDQHWLIGLWIVFFVGIHVWAFTAKSKQPVNQDVEDMWNDNLRGM